MSFPINNIYCIGRNYAKHIAELNNETPTEPLIFLKPNSCVQFSGSLKLPPFSENVHYETELVLQIGENCDEITPEQAHKLIAAYAVGLDLTARDVQDHAKSKGLPWTKAKGFRGAAAVSPFVPATPLTDWQNIDFKMKLNGSLQQHGCTHLMIYPINLLLAQLAKVYGLRRGDWVFTGTPEGVGPLHHGDVLELDLQNGLTSATFIVD